MKYTFGEGRKNRYSLRGRDAFRGTKRNEYGGGEEMRKSREKREESREQDIRYAYRKKNE
jgi:hypothetical protein